eukprot:11165739-Lingulodinium_polyedra.AAC.1
MRTVGRQSTLTLPLWMSGSAARPPKLSSRGSLSRTATASGGQALWHGQCKPAEQETELYEQA